MKRGSRLSRDCDSLVEAALLLMSGPDISISGPPEIAVAAVVEAGRLEELARAAFEQRLAPVLVEILDNRGSVVPDRLRAAVDLDRVQRLRSMSALSAIAGALDGAGLSWAIFKGPVVASFMSQPHLRRFNDLDILVSGPDLGVAINALVEAGVEEVNTNWDGYVRHRVGEVPMALGPVTVDLHWHLVGLGVHRATMGMDVLPMLERVRRRQVGEIEVSVFDPEDQLLHLALHSALSGAQRLDQLRDIAVLVSADPVDWEVLSERAVSWGIARLVAHALDRARLVVGADVDPDLIRELGGWPVSLRRWLDLRSSRPSSNMRALTVAIWRDGIVDSARAIWWIARSRVASTRGNPGWDISDEGGPLHYSARSGGPAQREAFIRGAAVWK